ncbi:hypothetical protein UM834_04575 [Staphylococcus aureus]|nr:hypothetical protein UM834_04575 [Staphylococcus aureus]
MNNMMNLVINQIVIKLHYRDDWNEFIDIYSNTILLRVNNKLNKHS